MECLFGKTVQILSSMLGFRSKRHQVISSNIANIDTPNYTSKDLRFKDVIGEEMHNRLTKSSEKHLSGHFVNSGLIDGEIVDTEERVNLDTEMVNLAENQLMYNVTVEFLVRKFKSINTVLREAK